jgi:hypothetical protein
MCRIMISIPMGISCYLGGILLALSAISAVASAYTGPMGPATELFGSVYFKAVWSSCACGIAVFVISNARSRRGPIFTNCTFLLLAIASGNAVARGNESCGCFGGFSPRSEIIFLVDVAIVLLSLLDVKRSFSATSLMTKKNALARCRDGCFPYDMDNFFRFNKYELYESKNAH